MKVVYIGSYPPRECGIGTFTQNLFSSMTDSGINEHLQHEGIVIAINDQETPYLYGKEVKLTIQQDQQRDYLEAAKFINLSGADVCILEHEFGIFGGQNGIYILPLLHRIEAPLIVTLHTVLKTPSYNEKAVLIEICKMAAKVVVMTHKAVEFLTAIYDVPLSKIELIEHGVPDITLDHQQAKKQLKLEHKKLLLTFGFISRNKGIETAIRALPAIVAKFPETLYLVLGKTHPAVIRHAGEEYRIFLLRLTKKLNMEKHVLFLNEFTDQEKLLQYLSAADIYITPYLNEAQITSGTLSYAIGAGTAVVSTPYWHAAELLGEGRGQLFDFNDAAGLSNILLDLLEQPAKLKNIRDKAFTYGKGIRWPIAGDKYNTLCKQVINEHEEKPVNKETILDPLILPPFLLDHIKRMTDDTGIIQHANFGIPNLKEGYCLDDNARALLMVAMAYKQMKSDLSLELMPIYLSYIHYMQNDDGSFRNFLNFRRDFLDEQGSEDSFGRAIWSLGYLLGNAPNDAYFQSARQIFFDAVSHFSQLKSIRSIANTIIGISHYLQANPGDEGVKQILRTLAYQLTNQYQTNKTESWHWFEEVIAYDNGLLPLSLLHAYEILKEDDLLQTGMESMQFLSGIVLKEEALSLVGNENWHTQNGSSSMYAQQPLDAMAMVLLFHKAFQVTKDKAYIGHLHTSFMWFLGENDMRMSLYDFETKGCCDGLESYGVNRNQGAESTLAYLIAHLTVLQVYNDFVKADI